MARELGRFLPVPRVTFDGTGYHLEYDRPDSIGKVRCFFGNAPTILRAYAWIMQHGADGLREVAECSVLNNNYLLKKLSEIPGVVIQYAQGKRRLEQVRYSWDKLKMGGEVCRRAGLDSLILSSVGGRETTWEDTERAAGQLLDRGVDLLLFAGGGGTARNVCKAVGSRLVTLGIPAGVKIHSAVYAVTPRDAGEVARRFLEGGLRSVREGEVMDIDEESYRQGVVEAKLYGYLRVPVEGR